MRLLMRFLKGPEVRYISHLDMQRLFQRALRRAGLPVGYSQGFHPHMLLSFASAMPLYVLISELNEPLANVNEPKSGMLAVVSLSVP